MVCFSHFHVTILSLTQAKLIVSAIATRFRDIVFKLTGKVTIIRNLMLVLWVSQSRAFVIPAYVVTGILAQVVVTECLVFLCVFSSKVSLDSTSVGSLT